MSLEELKASALRSHVHTAHERSKRWVDAQTYDELLRWHQATGCEH